MESFTTGTLPVAGAFRCARCGYVLNQTDAGALPACPSCDGQEFLRSSLVSSPAASIEATPAAAPSTLAAEARSRTASDAPHLAFRDGDEVRVVALETESTRIGRSLGAEIRFDDATVSRRHARVIRLGDGARVLDDRSLNGVFVNGRRIASHVLADGDEIAVGRHRLVFLLGATVAV